MKDNKSKELGIKNLKNGLSSYLKEVREGTRILITDRGSIVAEMHQYYGSASDSNSSELKAMLSRGELNAPQKKKNKCKTSPVSINTMISEKLLSEDRGR
jgi:antitoxin (DNA-binding transcriptional repressor) of toxin-antitoxin stability system